MRNLGLNANAHLGCDDSFSIITNITYVRSYKNANKISNASICMTLKPITYFMERLGF